MKKITKRQAQRATSLLEVLLALSLSILVATVVLASMITGLGEASRNKHRWQAFTIATQVMEMLAQAPRSATILNGDTTGQPNTAQDANCDDVIDPSRRYCTDQLGIQVECGAATGGLYEVCIKVRDGVPQGALKAVRVVVGFPTGSHGEGRGHVILQTVR